MSTESHSYMRRVLVSAKSDSVLCEEMNTEKNEKWEGKCRLRKRHSCPDSLADCSILVPPSHTHDYR